MIRFLIDRLVGLVLVVGVTLLSPALLVFGRSVRAKLIGLRAIMTLSAAATFTIWASDYSLNGGSPLGSDLLRYGFLPTFGLLWLLSLFLQVTGTRRHWDNVLGWSSLHHDRHLFVKAEARADVEADFLRVAVTVLTRLHPLLPRGRGAAMRAVMGDWLDELDEDGQLSRLPSMVTWGLAPLYLFDNSPSGGHAYVYVPSHAKGETLPLVIALHGHGGNFLVGCLPWRRLADELGFAVAFPSFGYGNWEHPHASEAIGRCLADVLRRYPIDGARVVLAGLSQGGCGVTRCSMSYRWSGMVYVSATMEAEVLRDDIAELWRGKPVLVWQGGRDLNVDPKTTDAGVAALRAHGAVVTDARDAEADHFLFFEKPDDFAGLFAAWWPTTEAAPAGGGSR